LIPKLCGLSREMVKEAAPWSRRVDEHLRHRRLGPQTSSKRIFC
jgi:hypothetical protein